MTTPASSRSTSAKLAVAAGAAGLLGGLALGATGLAGAASPDPTPTQPTTGQAVPHQEDGPEHRGGAGGLVSAISSSSITVRTPNGTKTVAVNDSTTYYDGKTATSRSAISVGDIVRIRVVDPKAASPVAASVTVVPAHLGGWVTKVDGSDFTITDHDGFTRTIHTTSVTTVTKDGAPSTLSAVTVGTFIRALGEVASDGTSLDASRIELGAPTRGPGGPGPRGEHGGRPGPAGAPGPDQPDA